jgi:hypothetical protein
MGQALVPIADEKVGLEVLRKAWVNLDLIWAVVLLSTAGFILLIPT